MRKLTRFILELIAVPIFVVSASAAPEYIPNQLQVVTKGVETDLRLQEMNTFCGTKIELPLMIMTRGKIYLLQIVDGHSVEDAIRCWEQFHEIKSAGPNYIVKPMK